MATTNPHRKVVFSSTPISKEGTQSLCFCEKKKMAETSVLPTHNPFNVASIPSIADDTISSDDCIPQSADDPMPLIDYSMLMSDDPVLHNKAVQELGKACQEYGYFSVINHTLPENISKNLIDGLLSFFDLPVEEKKEFEPKTAADSIRWGTGYNPADQAIVKREYLKVLRSDDSKWNFPTKPPGLSDAMQEFHPRLKEIGLRLLGGISEHLGQEECFIEKTLKLESGADLAGANIYPSVHETNSPMGQPSHYDPGLLTLFVQTGPGGLQLQYKGKWLKANIPVNGIFVNMGDHIEIFTNGKYKSLVHRVVVNNTVRRMSTGLLIGVPLDQVVRPAPEFLDETHPPAYQSLTYRDYLQFYNYHPIDVKSCLDKIRL